MKRYQINVGKDWSLRASVEFMLHGASLALSVAGPIRVELRSYACGVVSFYTDSEIFARALAVEISNYGLTVEQVD